MGTTEDLIDDIAAKAGKGPWLTYRAAAAYSGWSVQTLRNLVNAGRIPVYGRPGVRRFRRDMLDIYIADPDAAMRLFQSEGGAHVV